MFQYFVISSINIWKQFLKIPILLFLWLVIYFDN